jgi:hypothetical protein
LLSVAAILFDAHLVWAQGIDTNDPVLPPLDGVYRTADQVHAEFSGPGLAVILQKPEHQAILRELNVIVGLDEHETFFSTLMAEVNVNGSPFAPATANGPVSTVVRNKAGNTTGTFDTEMLSMSLTGNSPFGPFMIRESPTLPSLGRTSITDIGGGMYHIDSFFDVFTELSLDGGQTWIPDSQGPARVTLGPIIPEPTTAVLWAFGGIFAGLVTRRR